MTLTVILLVLIPAAFIAGGFAAVEIMCRIDCGVAINNDDHGFFDGWEHAALQAETPFSVGETAYDQETDPRPDERPSSAGYVTDMVQALRIPNERPKPYPPLRSVQ